MLLVALLVACHSDDPTQPKDDIGVTTDALTVDTGSATGDTGTTPPADPVTESFPWSPLPVDLLLVIDSSTSMTGRVAELTAAMAPLMEAWIAREIDFHVGVVDIDTAVVQGQLLEAGGRRWVDPEVPDPGLRLQQLVDQVGDPSTQEAGLASSYLALNMTGPGQYNEGFLRDGSDLAVVVATDEMDQTDPGLVTPNEYVDWLLGLRDDADLVGFHAFAATDDYVQVANQTGGVAWNVTNTPYGPALEAVTATVEADNAFVLAQDAVEDSLSVRVILPLGTEVDVESADLDYDSVRRTVDLGSYYPPAGSTVEITYVPSEE